MLLRALILGLLLLLCCSCDVADPSACLYEPDELFSSLLVEPIPTGISDIQGCALTWQGYRVWLRFEATDDALNELLTHGFSEATLDVVHGREMSDLAVRKLQERDDLRDEYRVNGLADEIPHFHLEFNPPWSLEEVQRVYEKSGFENAWSHAAIHTIMIDNKYVYFSGTGS